MFCAKLADLPVASLPLTSKYPENFTCSPAFVVTISNIPALPEASNDNADALLSIRSISVAAPVKSISPPLTVKSPVIVTSSGKPITILPLLPVTSVIAISLEVPWKVTVLSVPELASSVITAVFAPPADTGNVYVTTLEEVIHHASLLNMLNPISLAAFLFCLSGPSVSETSNTINSSEVTIV